MYFQRLLHLLSLQFVFSKRHVIRSTPKLRQQGYSGDIDLGELIAEAPAYSRENCVALCRTTPACRSVMLVGQLCRMFAPSACLYSANLNPYVLGEDASVKSFRSAMDKCLSLGAHSVHINCREEHEMIKEYIIRKGLTCRYVWTGGRSPVAGSTEPSDWRWYYSNDFTTPSQPLMYTSWSKNNPNNYNSSGQHYIAVDKDRDYDFNDLEDMPPGSQCFMCECP